MRTLMTAALAVAMGAAVQVLAGCAAIDRMAAEEVAAQNAADDAACRKYGYRPGNVAYAGCLERMDKRRAEDRAALLNLGIQMMSPPAASPPKLSCFQYGNYIDCD